MTRPGTAGSAGAFTDRGTSRLYALAHGSEGATRFRSPAADRLAADGVTATAGAVPVPERCDLCAQPLPASHRHLLDVSAGDPVCACRACAVLFDRRSAAGGHYRLLPERRLRLEPEVDDVRWAALGVPVQLAFFVRGSASGTVTACYPNPLGTMRAEVEPAAWAAIEQADPVLRDMADDVEALLVQRKEGIGRYWLLPLDDCYRLSAVLRTHWKGFGGGPEAARRIEHFFAELLTRS